MVMELGLSMQKAPRIFLQEQILGIITLPETNIAPTNGWLEYYFPIGEAYFQGLC